MTYENPVGGSIRMGDPFVLRTGNSYYLYGTTAGDGFKCWRSEDLVNWEPLGYAYRRNGQSWGKSSYWAPEVIRYRGKFYMTYSCQQNIESETHIPYKICLAVSDKPGGPFKDLHAPWFDIGWSCIDGNIFEDDDGTPYLYFNKVGKKEPEGYLFGLIYCAKLKPDLSGLAGDPVLCVEAVQDWENPESMDTRCNEGAFVFKRSGTYYMTYSANHYRHPFYGIGYATASSPSGPWIKNPSNPIVKRNQSINLSGPGHNSITTSPDGSELFMVYHSHADPEKPSGNRTVNIDRLIFDSDGTMRLIGPTRSPQPMPSGVK
jgi:beta-xylosidase